MPSYNVDDERTVVRIEEQYMEKLGIKPGDIVRISRNRATSAVCFDTDAIHQEPEGIDIQHVNIPKESYPIVRLSNMVFSKATIHGMGTLVKLDKLLPKEEITKASMVTISTTREAENIHGPDYEKRIDFAKYSGNVISKGDWINLQITGPDKYRYLSSVILDVKPAAKHDVWMVHEGTKFELREVANPNEYLRVSYNPNQLVDLVRVVPIVKKVEIEKDIQLTVPFLEIYENGSKIFFYLTERIHEVERVNVNGQEVTRPAQKLSGLSLANMEISDDKGNSYEYMQGGSHGGGATFPSNLPGWEFYSRHTLVYGLWPPIDKSVKELDILVKEFFWQRHEMPPHIPRPSPQPLERKDPAQTRKTGINESIQEKHVMTPVRRLGLSILSGPWRFKVSLN